MVSTKPAPYRAFSERTAEIRLTITGVVGLRKSVSPVFRDSEWPSKSMSSPSRPYRSMIALDRADELVPGRGGGELHLAVRAADGEQHLLAGLLGPDRGDELGLALHARAFGAGQRLNRMSPEVTDVGSPKARLMMSQSAGTSAIRR